LRPSPRQDLIEDIRDHIPEILHTHKGSQVAMRCIAYGTVKVRRRP